MSARPTHVNLSDICSIQGNKACADALSTIAITRTKEQPHHEATFIDRICGLHFCACSNSVCVGNADCQPEYTCRRWQPNHPSTWLGTSRWPRSSLWLGTSRWPRPPLWMGSRPPLWMRPSSPLVKTSLGDYSERSRLRSGGFFIWATRKSRQGFPRRLFGQVTQLPVEGDNAGLFLLFQ